MVNPKPSCTEDRNEKRSQWRVIEVGEGRVRGHLGVGQIPGSPGVSSSASDQLCNLGHITLFLSTSRYSQYKDVLEDSF